MRAHPHQQYRAMNKGKKILKIVAVAIIGLLLLGLILMGLWNWLVPSLFNGPQITFWQALGLFLLAKILFGGWRGKGRCGRGSSEWKHRYHEKLSSMTPEERERFKQRISEKWCRGSAPKEDLNTNV